MNMLRMGDIISKVCVLDFKKLQNFSYSQVTCFVAPSMKTTHKI